MSMLSSMCERLRATSDEVERIKNNNADWLWRDGVTLMDAVRELRDAADTIDHLRNTCHDLQSENAKLKQLVRAMWDVALHPQLFGDGSHLLKRLHDLGVEVEE